MLSRGSSPVQTPFWEWDVLSHADPAAELRKRSSTLNDALAESIERVPRRHTPHQRRRRRARAAAQGRGGRKGRGRKGEGAAADGAAAAAGSPLDGKAGEPKRGAPPAPAAAPERPEPVAEGRPPQSRALAAPEGFDWGGTY